MSWVLKTFVSPGSSFSLRQPLPGNPGPRDHIARSGVLYFLLAIGVEQIRVRPDLVEFGIGARHRGERCAEMLANRENLSVGVLQTAKLLVSISRTSEMQRDAQRRNVNSRPPTPNLSTLSSSSRCCEFEQARS